MFLDGDEDLLWEWQRLVFKYVVPESDSEANLDQALRFLQWVESPNFESPIYGAHVEDRPVMLKMASQIKERIIRACHDRDRGFLRRLLDAVIRPPKPLLDASNLTVVGLAVMTWAPLYAELGRCPNRWQLRERVEQARGARISDRYWGDVLEKLGSLVR